MVSWKEHLQSWGRLHGERAVRSGPRGRRSSDTYSHTEAGYVGVVAGRFRVELVQGLEQVSRPLAAAVDSYFSQEVLGSPADCRPA